MIDISGLPKHAVLAALWNAAKPQSIFDRKAAMSETRAREVADWLMESKLPDDRLDWLDSRVMKVDIRGDSFDPVLYDRDNGGEGAAARVIERLRQFNEVPEHVKQQKVSEVDPGTPEEVHGYGASQAQPQEAVLPQGRADAGAGDSGQEPPGGSHHA